MSECPFCNRDPYHYVDNGAGMEAVAVTCCDLGDQFFRGMRPAPEEVTLQWEEFQEIGSKLAYQLGRIEALAAEVERERTGREADNARLKIQRAMLCWTWKPS